MKLVVTFNDTRCEKIYTVQSYVFHTFNMVEFVYGPDDAEFVNLSDIFSIRGGQPRSV